VPRSHRANRRFELDDPYAEFVPPCLALVVLFLCSWTLLPNVTEFPSGRFWAAAAWSTFPVPGYLLLRAWIYSPRRLYAEFTAPELVIRSSSFAVTAAYSNIQGVSPHDTAWRRRLAAVRTRLGLASLPPCIRVNLREPIPRPLIGRTRRLLLRPRERPSFCKPCMRERLPPPSPCRFAAS
jgi:hypothetical protein